MGVRAEKARRLNLLRGDTVFSRARIRGAVPRRARALARAEHGGAALWALEMLGLYSRGGPGRRCPVPNLRLWTAKRCVYM